MKRKANSRWLSYRHLLSCFIFMVRVWISAQNYRLDKRFSICVICTKSGWGYTPVRSDNSWWFGRILMERKSEDVLSFNFSKPRWAPSDLLTRVASDFRGSRPTAATRKSIDSRFEIQEIKQACLVINTADYCQTTASEVGFLFLFEETTWTWLSSRRKSKERLMRTSRIK